jgi:hypothetical protein
VLSVGVHTCQLAALVVLTVFVWKAVVSIRAKQELKAAA